MAMKKAASTTKKAPSRSAKSSPRGAQPLPELVYAQASPRSVGGVSLFDTSRAPAGQSVVAFTSEEPVIRSAASQLQAAGFRVLQISPLTINIAGPPQLYEEVFGTSLYTEERPVRKGGGREDMATFIETADTDMAGLVATGASPLVNVVEGVAIERPVYPMESAFAPSKGYWHLRLPGDISLGCNADAAHRAGVTGKGVKVAMVDSGQYRHPYFLRRGYNMSPVVLGPGATNAADDESGHGTGESANVFAVAPDVDFTMVKTDFVNSTGSFNAAVALSPDIVTCSWGNDVELPPLDAADVALAAAVALAVANGVIVVFAAGNGHYGTPGQHPDVISAGGVFMGPDESLRASDYTSGFASNVYPGRNVPDLSGLVGMLPAACYLMLPVQPGDALDAAFGVGGTFPGPPEAPTDETAPDDGWAAFSGTSAAAPQIAGACALLRQVDPAISPAEVRDILRSSARDVTAGKNHPRFGNPATAGYDVATGAGLLDAHRAVQLASVRRLVAGQGYTAPAPPTEPMISATTPSLAGPSTAAVRAAVPAGSPAGFAFDVARLVEQAIIGR